MHTHPSRPATLAILLSLIASIAGCGGGSGGSTTLTPPPPPPPPPAAPDIDVQQVFANLAFSQPVAMVQAPGASRWYVVEQRGVVRAFDNDPNTSASEVAIDIAMRVNSGFNESGLLGIAFHPQFPATPELFLSYTGSSGNQLVSNVSRFFADANGVFDPNSEQILLSVLQPQGNHNGGDLAFGEDGNLYAAFGDGGGAGDPGDNGQNVATLMGAILRIGVDGNSPYEIPLDNPFAGNALCTQGFGGDACPEIFAWGLRNPWRMSFDSQTGSLWVGDVGQGDWEEVDRIELDGDYADNNFGWNDREGAHCYPPGSTCSTDSLDPVAEYDHGVGRSITGGYVYRGAAISGLAGWYVFGDFVTGRLFAVPEDSQPTVAPDILLETTLSISSFAEDTDGELYVIDYGGTIHKIVAAP